MKPIPSSTGSFKPLPRSSAQEKVARALGGKSADIVCSATPRMLDGVGAKIADERRQVGPSKGCGLGALRKVAGPMMLEECGKVEREQKGLQAGVSTDGARDPAHYRPQSAPNGRRGGGWVAVGAQFAHPDKD
jgi:hypothetical protein